MNDVEVLVQLVESLRILDEVLNNNTEISSLLIVEEKLEKAAEAIRRRIEILRIGE